MAGKASIQMSDVHVTFAELMGLDTGVESFMQFLEHEFSEENLVFWVKAKLYRSESWKSEADRKAELAEMYSTYISDTDKFQVCYPPCSCD